MRQKRDVSLYTAIFSLFCLACHVMKVIDPVSDKACGCPARYIVITPEPKKLISLYRSFQESNLWLLPTTPTGRPLRSSNQSTEWVLYYRHSITVAHIVYHLRVKSCVTSVNDRTDLQISSFVTLYFHKNIFCMTRHWLVCCLFFV